MAATLTKSTTTAVDDDLVGSNVAAGASSSAASSSADLWTQILLSVQTAKSTPVCPIVILGEPQSGKSTLIRALAEGSVGGYVEPQRASREETEHAAADPNASSSSSRGKKDLALAYGYCDVPDDEGEDVLARMSIYTLYSSAHELLLQRIPFGGERSAANVSPLRALANSLFVITLDWTRPQAFLEELRAWIAIIKGVVKDAADRSVGGGGGGGDEKQRRRAVEKMLQEMKDRVELSFRSYTPPGGTATATATATTGADDTTPSAPPQIVPLKNPSDSRLSSALADDPLEEGILDENLGVNVVVVLTKSDTLGALERNRNFKEEQFDYVQQVLRTICLKYGAALFSTAQSRSGSFDVLRQYLLHRGNDGGANDSAPSPPPPFTHPALTIERDVLLVPAGWDTWGKITALREDFSPASTARGWEWDRRVAEKQRDAKGVTLTLQQAEKQLQEEEGMETVPPSACRLWEDVVGDDWQAARSAQVQSQSVSRARRGGRDSIAAGANTASSAANAASQVQPPDTQAFLSSHYNALQRDAGGVGGSSSLAGTDPRAKFGATPSSKTADSSATPSSSSSRPAVVGPMQSTGLSGPNVERFMARNAGADEGLGVGDASGGAASGGGGGGGLSSRDTMAGGAAAGGGPSTPASLSTATAGLRPKSSRRESRGDRAQSPGAAGAASPTSPGGGGATKQSEVLQSFFQDLLRGKSGSPGPGGGGGGGGGSGGSSSSAGGVSARRATNSRPPAEGREGGS